MKARFHFFIILITSSFICFTSRGQNNIDYKKNIYTPDLKLILDSSDVIGSIMVYDAQKQLYYSNDFKWANTGRLPASTFKIANSIIALETVVVEDENSLFKWDGKKRKLSSWEKDLSLTEAFHASCVPCYQEVARKIGSQRMKMYLSKLSYGNMIVDSNTIDLFWLEGKSKISQVQQIDFLRRFYFSQLLISKRTEQIMKKLMVTDSTDSYTISGKTGWAIRNGNNNGWFVGYIEIATNVYFFAINISPTQTFNMDMFPMIRKEITLKALKKLRIIH
jgi:beta-lactamase class D